ncbi:unnamed protein product [Linum trigynum]|uniref:Uncharacterized protein n=1 Tax=Linum trigynum TaxID=586398 RepID=A0AAV2EB91_9ROSI
MNSGSSERRRRHDLLTQRNRVMEAGVGSLDKIASCSSSGSHWLTGRRRRTWLVCPAEMHKNNRRERERERERERVIGGGGRMVGGREWKRGETEWRWAEVGGGVMPSSRVGGERGGEWRRWADAVV